MPQPKLPPHLKKLLNQVDKELLVDKQPYKELEKLNPYNWPHLVYSQQPPKKPQK
jgi:hypothetical protein